MLETRFICDHIRYPKGVNPRLIIRPEASALRRTHVASQKGIATGRGPRCGLLVEIYRAGIACPAAIAVASANLFRRFFCA
jgi:hypothetical protein